MNREPLETKILTLTLAKILSTKAELKAQQDKIVKLQIDDISIFISQSYFDNDESQNYIVFQPIQKN